MKPGYKTSEFWFTLVSFIFSGFYLVGLIGDNNQKEDLIRDVSHGVESVILIAGQLAILWKYVNSRKEIKKTWSNSATEIEKIETAKKNNTKILNPTVSVNDNVKEESDDRKRTSKSKKPSKAITRTPSKKSKKST